MVVCMTIENMILTTGMAISTYITAETLGQIIAYMPIPIHG